MIHVCSLSRVRETVTATGARHMVTLLGDGDHVARPASIMAENHLWLRVHDISAPLDGHVTPEAEHVEQLLAFVRQWPREAPLVIHCYAGISRSTAAAFVSVCALNPLHDEAVVARALRRASPTATPNARIISLADKLLERKGRMVKAIEAIGTGMPASEATPFLLNLQGH